MDHTFNFYAEINDDGVKLERCYPGAMGDNVYKLRRLHSAHPSNNVCRQLTALVTDNTVIFFCYLYSVVLLQIVLAIHNSML